MTIIGALAQLRDDLIAWVTNNLHTKVTKETGKGLSTNDYTNTEKQKVDGSIKGLSVDGKIITYTKNDGNTETIVTQDTVYEHPETHSADMITGLANVATSGEYDDLENKPNITDDESDNVVIADPDGNVVFKVDADGAHTTALTVDGKNVETTSVRLFKDEITEVNLTKTAQTGEIVLGTAATKGVTDYTSTNAYLAASSNTLPSCATLYNFIQITEELITHIIPAGEHFSNVHLGVNDELPKPAKANEILIPVASLEGESYMTLHRSSESGNTVDSITFHRTKTDTESLASQVLCKCYLMRVKIMKY